MKLLILLLLTILCIHANAQPKEVVDLEAAFKAIPGITGVSVSKHHFSEEEIASLKEVYFGGTYADLPIAMYKRSGGNLKNEILVFVEFTIEKNEKGLDALEYLSWWTRDLSRSGDNVQIRSIGLPPIVGDNTQLGSTLKFWFEAYIVTEKEEMSLVLAKVGELASSLESANKLYASVFK